MICAPALGWSDEDFYRNEIAPVAGQRLAQEPAGVTRAAHLDMLLESLEQVHPRLVPSLLQKLGGGALPPDLIETVKRMAEPGSRLNIFDDARGPRPVMIHFGDGESLESADIVSRLAGGYTLPTGYRHEKSYRAKPPNLRHPLTDISVALGGYQFNFLNFASLDFALGIRKDDRFNRLRAYLNRMWSSPSEQLIEAGGDRISLLREELGVEYRQYKDEWNLIEKKLLGEVAAVGIATFAAGTFTLVPSLLVGLSTALGLAVKSHYARQKLRMDALSVFVDLDK